MSVRILVGDVREQLAALADDSVDCVVTSPPYWGLRDYGVAGQIGLEPTLGEHLAVMVEVFREVRRVLKPNGTLWLNYGDCYATTPNGRSAADTKAAGNDDRTFRDKPFGTVGPIFVANHESGDRRGQSGNKGSAGQSAHTGRIVAGGYLKPGDLCMVPNRLAIALQDDGWWVKSEIIWGKPNAMPDSAGVVRPSTAHEKIFLLAKSNSSEIWRARDTGEISAHPDLTERVPMVTTGELGHRWIRMPFYYNAAEIRVGRVQDESAGLTGKHHGRHTLGEALPAAQRRDKQRGHSRRHQGFNDRWDKMERDEQIANGRLLRNYEPAPLSVWDIAIKGFKEAHFATFPPELAERCIKAGCPMGGTVLDPFGGAGTTGLVADRRGRNAILIELNPEYAAMAECRIKGDSPLFTEVA